MLTAQRARELLTYDPSTGMLCWTTSRGRARAGKQAGCIHSDGYRNICVDGRLYPAHRLAWLHTHGVWPLQQIDHINGDKCDNRLENLRDVSQTVNLHNIKNALPSSASGVRGVSWNPRVRRYEAQIQVRGKKKYLGVYRSIEDATAAFQAAKADAG